MYYKMTAKLLIGTGSTVPRIKDLGGGKPHTSQFLPLKTQGIKVNLRHVQQIRPNPQEGRLRNLAGTLTAAVGRNGEQQHHAGDKDFALLNHTRKWYRWASCNAPVQDGPEVSLESCSTSPGTLQARKRHRERSPG